MCEVQAARETYVQPNGDTDFTDLISVGYQGGVILSDVSQYADNEFQGVVTITAADSRLPNDFVLETHYGIGNFGSCTGTYEGVVTEGVTGSDSSDYATETSCTITFACEGGLKPS